MMEEKTCLDDNHPHYVDRKACDIYVKEGKIRAQEFWEEMKKADTRVIKPKSEYL
jgi:hypothetical protein